MRFILVRHCETDWNAAGRLQGHTDTELNENGKIQAHTLAREISPLGVHRTISSDLKRAVQTADIVLRSLKVPVSFDARLREASFGALEGRTPEDVVREHGIAPHYSSGLFDFRRFGGEARDEVLARHRHLLDELAEKHSTETLLLVGHGAGLNTLLADLGHEPTLKRGEYRIIEY